MITDLFSHKIHSSGSEWPDKLVELKLKPVRFRRYPSSDYACPCNEPGIIPKTELYERIKEALTEHYGEPVE